MTRLNKALLRSHSLPMRLLLRFVRRLGRILFRPQFSGIENIPSQGPFVLIGNHQHFFDVILVHMEMPENPRWVAKKELFDIPIISKIICELEAIPLDRNKASLSAVKEIRKTLKEGRIAALFPQGTRVSSENITKILPSDAVVNLLSRVQVPILPFAVEVPLRMFRKNRIVFGQPFYLDRSANEHPESTKRFIMGKIYENLGQLPNIPVRQWLEMGIEEQANND